ncbi:MAG: pirin family protein [Candidatus Omnitrophota bacterium]
MIKVRKSGDRGHLNFGWLDTYHTFSFGEYHDQAHMGFRTLRVINEDRVEPGQGFPTHSHRDMEIITYIIEGALEHKDSMGNASVIRPGDIQRMSAGTGVRHSEFNPSKKDPVHLLQIWILPDQTGLPPGYEQKTFPAEDRRNHLKLVASGKPTKGLVRVHQDVNLYECLLEKDRSLDHKIEGNRALWLQMVKGKAKINETTVGEGDGAAVEGEPKLTLTAGHDSLFLLFDLI